MPETAKPILTGKTEPSNNAYVGLHVAKIGHNEAHNRISHRIQFWESVITSLRESERRSDLKPATIPSRIFGNTNTNPYNPIIVHEINVHVDGSIFTKLVLILNRYVNTKIQTIADVIILSGFRLSHTNPPQNIIGIMGNTQGASTLSNPAKNDTRIIVIWNLLL